MRGIQAITLFAIILIATPLGAANPFFDKVQAALDQAFAGSPSAAINIFDTLVDNSASACAKTPDDFCSTYATYPIILAALQESDDSPVIARDTYKRALAFADLDPKLRTFAERRITEIDHNNALSINESKGLIQALWRQATVRSTQWAKEEGRKTFDNAGNSDLSAALATIAGALASNRPNAQGYRPIPSSTGGAGYRPIPSDQTPSRPQISPGTPSASPTQSGSGGSFYNQRPQWNANSGTSSSTARTTQFRNASSCVGRVSRLVGASPRTFLHNSCGLKVEVRACTEQSGGFRCKTEGVFGGSWTIQDGGEAFVAESAGKTLLWVACESPGIPHRVTYSPATGLHMDGCF